MRSRILTETLVAGLFVINANPGYSQNYPTKPIRVYTAAAGTQADFIARLIAQSIAGPLGQPVVVDNRAPVIAAETVAKAPDISFRTSMWLFTNSTSLFGK